ncbi:hypothetical protein KGM_203117 [Danaus plexippus plexippus]|uniref:Uncharacterized protein n=1 Tax=Danaus plexippus plexippus TaxID=278856 RepID=A0A212FEE4_DANPL|nr:hypothetical protein KGM_203117 [Danaus plexippus plexippus]
MSEVRVTHDSIECGLWRRELRIPDAAALCADYSVPVDCVAAGPAPRPSSFHEISAPKIKY